MPHEPCWVTSITLKEFMSHWESNKALLETLKIAYMEGNLALFLGAGISKGCGLPLWGELIQSLFIEANRDAFPTHGAYGSIENPRSWGGLIRKHINIDHEELQKLPAPVQERYCKRRLGKNFAKRLQEVLYAQKYSCSDTLHAISRLVGIKAICTYNYDNILEANASQFKSISTPPLNIRPGEIPVYHVHGMIPSDLNTTPSGEFILAEDEYHRTYADPYHWSNTTQLFLLSNTVCLFIGLSFADPNLRRLIDIAGRTNSQNTLINVLRFPETRPKQDHLNTFSRRRQFFDDAFGEMGIQNFWVDSYEPDIPILLKSLLQPDSWQSYAEEMRNAIISTIPVISGQSLKDEIISMEFHGYIPKLP